MDKKDFKMLMYALYGNKQLIIPDGQTLQQWIDNAFIEKKKEAINYTHCCESDSEQLFDFLEWFDNYCTVDVKPNKEDVELYLSK
jgi:hypothetical protein